MDHIDDKNDIILSSRCLIESRTLFFKLNQKIKTNDNILQKDQNAKINLITKSRTNNTRRVVIKRRRRFILDKSKNVDFLTKKAKNNYLTSQEESKKESFPALNTHNKWKVKNILLESILMFYLYKIYLYKKNLITVRSTANIIKQ